MTTSEISLQEEYVTDAVDHRGFAAKRSNTGRWRAALFIIDNSNRELLCYTTFSSSFFFFLRTFLQVWRWRRGSLTMESDQT